MAPYTGAIHRRPRSDSGAVEMKTTTKITLVVWARRGRSYTVRCPEADITQLLTVKQRAALDRGEIVHPAAGTFADAVAVARLAL